MKKLIVFVILFPLLSFSQFGGYFEFGGSAQMGASFNLEYRLVSKNIDFSINGGVGITYDAWDPVYDFFWESFPVGFKTIFFDGNHHLETGLGVLIFPMGYYNTTFTQIPLAYRFQKSDKSGLTFRAGILADLTESSIYPHISFGYFFNGRKNKGSSVTEIVVNYDDVKIEKSSKKIPENETSDNLISDPNEIIFKKTLYETMIENGYSHEEADSRSSLGAVKMKLDFEKSSTYYSSGLNKISSKDYDGAIEDFTESIDLFLFNPQSFTSRGRVKHKLGDYDGAIEDLNTAISQDSDYDEAYFRRSFSKMALKNYIGAVADLNKLILLNNEYPKCYYWLGMAKFRLEDYLGASDALSLAIKRDPSNPDLYFNRANFNAMCKRPFCNDFKTSCDYGHERACEMYYKMCK